MERAAGSASSSQPQPLYDLPTYLSVTHPHARVEPRNPAYDWRRSPELAAGGPRRAALLLAVDAHMAQPESREALLRMAQLELAHLWYYQQHAAELPAAASSTTSSEAEASASSSGAAAGPAAAAAAAAGTRAGGKGKKGAAAQPEGAAAASSSPATEADAVQAAAAAAGDEDDDIFAAADRKARERAAAVQAATAAAAASAATASSSGGRGGEGRLPPEVLARVRDIQMRRGMGGRDAASALRIVADSFARRLPSGGRWMEGSAEAEAAAAEAGGDPTAALAWALAGDGVSGFSRHMARQMAQAKAADRVILGAMQSLTDAVNTSTSTSTSTASTSTSSYWAAHPTLAYDQTLAARAHRQGLAWRAAAEAGPDGAASLSAAITALSASLRRPPPTTSTSTAAGSSQPPATPVLDLLLDYLQAKYADLLTAWETAARLREATERVAAAVARARATVPVAAVPPLPPALAAQLERSWQAAAAAFRPALLQPLLQPGAASAAASGATSLAAAAASGSPALLQAQASLNSPLDWAKAKALIEQHYAKEQQAAAAAGATAAAEATAAAAAATAAAAAAAGSPRGAVEALLQPLLQRAAARHRALLAGGGVAAAEAAVAATAAAGADSAAGATAAATAEGAAGVVCFRETLTLDASSAFANSSHDSRVALEFNVDRLAAAEPGLGGAWGARLLERLLTTPALVGGGSSSRSRSSSMFGRRKATVAARAAANAAAYPVDVEHSFCASTRTACLTTSRYGSREANRKLLLEHYEQLLRAVALAAAAGAPSSGASVV